MIRALFFDLDGTLIDRGRLHRRYCLDLMRRFPEVFPREHRARDLQVLLSADGTPRWDRRVLAWRLARAYPHLKLTAAELAADHAGRIAQLVRPDPSVVLLLRTLTRRFHLAIVSNGSSAVQRAKLDHAGIATAFGDVFISGEIGVAKPDPALFQRALEPAGCGPGEAMFIGDDPVCDIAGAASAGLMTCWVSSGRAFPEGIAPPDRTIAQIRQLAEVLE